MIMSEQVSLQERASQEPAQEPQAQTEKVEPKWVKRNVHRSVQQKLCNASRDKKDVMCKMRISTFQDAMCKMRISIPSCMCKMRISIPSASSCKVQIAHRGLTTVKCIVKSRKSLIDI